MAMTKHINAHKFADYIQFSGFHRPTQWSHIKVLEFSSASKCESGLNLTHMNVALFFQHKPRFK